MTKYPYKIRRNNPFKLELAGCIVGILIASLVILASAAEYAIGESADPCANTCVCLSEDQTG